MANGKIAHLKSDSVGYISTAGRSDFQFDRSEFRSNVEWSRDVLIGRAVRFTTPDGSIATNVRLIED